MREPAGDASVPTELPALFKNLLVSATSPPLLPLLCHSCYTYPMKAIIYHAYNDIRLEDLPIPRISDDELLVRVHGCGLCGSDILKIVQQAAPPVILGHELSGTI